MTITLPAIAATHSLGGELMWVCVRVDIHVHTYALRAVVVVTNPVCLLRRRTLDLFPSHQHTHTCARGGK